MSGAPNRKFATSRLGAFWSRLDRLVSGSDFARINWSCSLLAAWSNVSLRLRIVLAHKPCLPMHILLDNLMLRLLLRLDQRISKI